MKKIFFLVLLLAALPASGQNFKKNATAGFVFLELPVTARHAALGEASAGLSDTHSEAVFLNPAALGFTTRVHSLSASYAPWLADIKHYASSYSFKSPLGVFAASVVVLDFGTMPRTVRGAGQRVYESVGEFKASALAVGLTFSRKLTDQFSFGVTVKYAREAIDVYAAKNFLFDGGVLYYTGLGSFRLGASVQNFGTDAQYKNDPFKMPAMLRLGVAMDVLGGDPDADLRVTTAADALHPSDGDERVNVGLEVAWRELLSIRGGYKFFYDEESYTVGVGLKPDRAIPVGVDFAYAEYGRLGNVVRFTLQVGLEE